MKTSKSPKRVQLHLSASSSQQLCLSQSSLPDDLYDSTLSAGHDDEPDQDELEMEKEMEEQAASNRQQHTVRVLSLLEAKSIGATSGRGSRSRGAARRSRCDVCNVWTDGNVCKECNDQGFSCT